MSWVEKTGKHSWRIRYPNGNGTYGSLSGFTSRKAAENYAHDLENRPPPRHLDQPHRLPHHLDRLPLGRTRRPAP
ncbi:hypothetical protein [Goodfellowiella coeruleoviolacea]|uniref:DUF1508 domain-containing protein n=1 Tax=Goodfellowiella coeruleoviolacea TaxID=334858 RepID=A0AAE3GGP7_9PSEU|nr:hypothetical protein [Goodfellowiella coeruleoviolacea]MCP2167926.1 hypothetical protein [Goodfellowiella coeruleoviolacea]